MSILILIIGISVLILVHEFGHFIVAKKAGLLVEEFGIGFPPRLYGKKIGETIYSINWLPLGGFVKIYGENKAVLDELRKNGGEVISEQRSFSFQSAPKRLLIVGAGVAMNFFAGWILLSVVLMIGAPAKVVVTEVVPESPAAIAGVMSGDVIADFQTAPLFIEEINKNKGREFEFAVERSGTKISVKATPRVEYSPNEGSLGVGLTDVGIEKYSFFKAIKEALFQSVQMMAAIISSIGAMIGGLFGSGDGAGNVVGPVGIFRLAGEFGTMGFAYLLQFIAMISLNLAVLNAVPFPALDGGRALFIIIEKLKRSPMPAKNEMIANMIGFGVLLLLMLLITIRDVVRLF